MNKDIGNKPLNFFGRLKRKISTWQSYGVKYSWPMNFREFLFLLKPNKRCPICNNNLKTQKNKIDLGIEEIFVEDHYVSGHHYEIRYVFSCQNCNKDFQLKEVDEISS